MGIATIGDSASPLGCEGIGSLNSEFKNDEVWLLATSEKLSADDALNFASVPEAGAVVLFSGDVRNHSGNRTGVISLEYEAYESKLIGSFEAIAENAKSRFDGLCRIVIFHRLGLCRVGESTVVVVVSSEHRDSGFAAAKYCIDTLKHTSPIWKKEIWAEGNDWALNANQIQRAEEL